MQWRQKVMEERNEAQGFLLRKEIRNEMIRKKQLEDYLITRRLNPYQTKQEAPAEEKEEKKKPKTETFTPQERKQKNIRCWNCKEVGHKKNFCYTTKCFNCGKKGHMKKHCLFLLVPLIKKMDRTAKTEGLVENLKNRLKELEFKNIKNRVFALDHQVLIGEYTGPTPINEQDLKSTFNIPSDRLSQTLRSSSKRKDLLHPKLLTQCCDGEVRTVTDLEEHNKIKHGGYFQKGLHFNIPQLQLWLDWKDDEDFLQLFYNNEDDYYKNYFGWDEKNNI